MGFGFVTFASAAEADSAQEKLTGTIVEGRIIKVENYTSWSNASKKMSELGLVVRQEMMEENMGIAAAADLQTSQENTAASQVAAAHADGSGPKRLFITNIPYSFMKPDLQNL